MCFTWMSGESFDSILGVSEARTPTVFPHVCPTCFIHPVIQTNEPNALCQEVFEAPL